MVVSGTSAKDVNVAVDDIVYEPEVPATE